MRDDETWDTIVVGGGPAGLCGALWLARYRRKVRVFDEEDPRNKATWGVHGYFGIEDPPPLELRDRGRKQAVDAGAVYEAASVERIEGETDDFVVTLADGREFATRRVLLATGLKDIVPEIPGFDELYGTSIWHCPDCDGPTVADLKVGVLGWGDGIVKYLMYMLTWTDRLLLLTHGHDPALSPEAAAALERFDIPVRTDVIERFEQTDGCLRTIAYHGGDADDVDAVFFHIACGPGSTLAADLGCEMDDDGILSVDAEMETTVPGIYAAGDITPGSRLALRAAAEGARAAVGIHKSLVPAERRL
jgi:thioredoxin reductase